MTIWSGRTQRSIASGFAAASMSGNRTLRSVVPSGRRVLHSVVPSGRRVLHSVAAPVGAATLPLKAPSGNHALRAISRNSA